MVIHTYNNESKTYQYEKKVTNCYLETQKLYSIERPKENVKRKTNILDSHVESDGAEIIQAP